MVLGRWYWWTTHQTQYAHTPTQHSLPIIRTMRSHRRTAHGRGSQAVRHQALAAETGGWNGPNAQRRDTAGCQRNSFACITVSISPLIPHATEQSIGVQSLHRINDCIALLNPVCCQKWPSPLSSCCNGQIVQALPPFGSAIGHGYNFDDKSGSVIGVRQRVAHGDPLFGV